MNEQIEQLESQLEELGGLKRIALYVILFASFIYMSWTMYGEELSMQIESSKDRIASLENKLQKNSNRALQNAIVRTEKSTLALQDDINRLHFQKQFVRTKLQNIDFIFYDEKGSAKMLDDILRNSVMNGVDIDYITKSVFERNATVMVEPRSAVAIEGVASLDAIVHFLHYIENINALVLTKDIAIGLDEDNATRFHVDLIHYGVEL